jgi:RHS repeat-associated protein
LTDTSGNVVSTIEVDPFGGESLRMVNQLRQPHRYTTYERDGNGGDEAMLRRYEGRWQRFAQPDPYDGSYDLSNPQSLNRYAYTQSDPVNFVDPTGLQANNCEFHEGEWRCYDSADTIRVFTWDKIDRFLNDWMFVLNSRFGGYTGNDRGDRELTQDPERKVPLIGHAAKSDDDCDDKLQQAGANLASFLSDSSRYIGESGHFKEITQRQAGLNGALNSLDKCSKNWQKRNSEALDRLREGANRPHAKPHYTDRIITPGRVGTAIGIGVGAYAVYRIIRLLPSLAPPLWWTIPANVAIP